MPRYRTAYPPEFRRQMVDLVRSARTPEELAREFEPTAQSISTWVKQAPSGMPASALTGRQALSGRNWRAFDDPLEIIRVRQHFATLLKRIGRVDVESLAPCLASLLDHTHLPVAGGQEHAGGVSFGVANDAPFQ